jgi:hypothetical protein
VDSGEIEIWPEQLHEVVTSFDQTELLLG